MREGFEDIAIRLAGWCKKYNKDYATSCYVKNHVYANIHPQNEDYGKTNIALLDEKDIQDKIDKIGLYSVKNWNFEKLFKTEEVTIEEIFDVLEECYFKIESLEEKIGDLENQEENEDDYEERKLNV